MPKLHRDSSKSLAKRKRKPDPNHSVQETSKSAQDDTMMDTSSASNVASVLRNQNLLSKQIFGAFEGHTLNAPKIVEVKNLKNFDWSEDVFAQNSWNQLKRALVAIREQRSCEICIEELYQLVEETCFMNGHDFTLLKNLMSEFESYCNDIVTQLGSGFDDTMAWLVKLEKAWSEYCENLVFIQSIFLALDRKLLDNQSIRYVAVKKFETVVLGDAMVQGRWLDGLLWLVRCERDGKDVDRALIKGLFQMIDKAHVYRSVFETPFLSATESYYQAEGCRLIENSNISSFMNCAHEIIEREKKLASLYLDFDSACRLLRAVEVGLIREHLPTVLNKGFNQMMDDGKVDRLNLLYKLCLPVPGGLKELCCAFVAYLKRVGTELASGTQNENCIIPNMIEFMETMKHVVLECFENHADFDHAIGVALESIFTQCHNRPAELIAKFIDMKLRSGKVATMEEDLETLMAKTMRLFRFVPEKDLFESYYQKMLGKRLLQSKSASFDAERTVIEKLKNECGTEFTAKLDVMFKDIELSKELNLACREANLNTDKKSSLEMSVSVLSNTNWPDYQSSSVNLPANMRACQENFENFYLGKHSGRKITWQHSVGSCVLLANFGDKGEKELQVSTYQAIVLLLFNNKEVLTYDEIKSLTGINDDELQRTLQSLACGKYRVIVKNPKGKDVEPGDKFFFNHQFENKLMRIKINQVQNIEIPKEKEVTYEQVKQTRAYQVDATIVRVMKMKKRLSHNALITELHQILGFAPKSFELKERIECMIDQGYLCREAENNDHYSYIA